jgi:hypothetical protein
MVYFFGIWALRFLIWAMRGISMWRAGLVAGSGAMILPDNSPIRPTANSGIVGLRGHRALRALV